ncbi:glutathione S-transferase family protein [Eoetvoesiella caeni]
MSSRLCIFGSPFSSYYNKIKIALIELDLPFEEVPFMPGAGNWPESGSPSGKIPFLHTADGNIYESQAIVEYLEDIRPQTSASLFPANPIERAHCRELIQYIELYLDAAVRPVYPAAFWGKTLNQDELEEALKNLEKGLRTLERRANLQQWLCGERYTHADAAAWVHLSTIRRMLKILGQEEFLGRHLPALPGYLERLAERPSTRRVEADRHEAGRALKKQQSASQGD